MSVVGALSTLATLDGTAPGVAAAVGAYQSVTIQGTIAKLNNQLSTLLYYNDVNFNTEILPLNVETLTIAVNDLGNTDYQTDGTLNDGTTTLNSDPTSAFKLTATTTLNLIVLPTNDAPTIDTSAGTLSQVNLTVPEDAPAGLSIVGIQVFENPDDLYDPDDVIVNVTLSVVHGGLKLTTGGATGVSVVGALSTLATLDGTAPGVAAAVGAYQSVTIQGTIAELNNQLVRCCTTTDVNFNTEILPLNVETLTIAVNDLGNTDYQTDGTLTDGTTTLNSDPTSAFKLTATTTLNLIVLPTNDAPTIDTSAGTLSQVNLTVPEDAPAGLSGLLASRYSRTPTTCTIRMM